MADITYRLVKGTELTFGELDRNFGSLDSDITNLSDRLDSVSSGLDSAQIVTLITSTVDSDYVAARDSDQASSYTDSDVITLLTGPTIISLDASPTDGASDDF